jgi:hypothetical protein
MTDQEFEKLELRLEFAIRDLNELQRQYRRQTGQSFICPLRLDPLPESARPETAEGKIIRDMWEALYGHDYGVDRLFEESQWEV